MKKLGIFETGQEMIYDFKLQVCVCAGRGQGQYTFQNLEDRLGYKAVFLA